MTWNIESNRFDIKKLQLEESLFSLGNGYLGIRGNLEELDKEVMESFSVSSVRGTYINAFYDDVEIPYAEKGFAYPQTSQKMLNLTDTQTIKIFLGDELFTPFKGKIIDYHRTLYLKRGYAERVIHYRSPLGKEVKLTFKRIVSFKYQELFFQEVTITPINYFGPVKIVSTVNGEIENYVDKSDPRVAQGHAKRLHIKNHHIVEDYGIIESVTEQSNLSVLALSQTKVNGAFLDSIRWENKQIVSTYHLDLIHPITINKRSIYLDSIRYEDNLLEKALSRFKEIKDLPFDDLVKYQESYLTDYFNNSDIRITGNSDLQLGIRFNLYHLIQSVGRDKYSNIAAKGLSGEGYEGHYFWDTEIFIFPVFLLTKPSLAKNLLMYRYNTLDYARLRAKEMGHKKGALYPWRTIKGSECSSFFPASSAQYHINADISYSIVTYYLATGDLDFIALYGAEIIFETARLFIDLGHYNENGFNIFSVTGPDEYTAIVDNNFYTNVMAKYNLKWAVKLYNLFKVEHPEILNQLIAKINLTDDEVLEFQKAAENMYLPYDERLKINPQDDSFLRKPLWDFDNTPKENYPLLLNYHLLTIYRHQVCKQADTVLAHLLLEDEVSIETIRNSYYYYEKVTTHDSSLSSCIYSIMAMKINEIEKGYNYFIETARLDLDNTHKNTKDGLHMANMGGTYLTIVYGFAGLRIKESGLFISPKIPKQIGSYQFKIKYRGRNIRITVNQNEYQIELLEGEALLINIYDRQILLTDIICDKF